MSSHRLQLLMYQRSSSTRFSIKSIVAVPPRNPWIWAHPVMPGGNGNRNGKWWRQRQRERKRPQERRSWPRQELGSTSGAQTQEYSAQPCQGMTRPLDIKGMEHRVRSATALRQELESWLRKGQRGRRKVRASIANGGHSKVVQPGAKCFRHQVLFQPVPCAPSAVQSEPSSPRWCSQFFHRWQAAVEQSAKKLARITQGKY